MSAPVEIRDIVRRNHVHYDLAMTAGGGSFPAGDGTVVLRLWAVHQKGARALPGCDKCRPLMGDLRSLAQFVFRGSEVAVIEETFRSALYDSAIVPGADEIALEIRLSSGLSSGDQRPSSTPGSAGGVRHGLKRVRSLLQELGIPER